MEPELGIPVMEHHTTLNEELNNSCETSKLTSWTKHVNHKGTVYTIRFLGKEAILDPKDQVNSIEATTVKYKPKSQYHITRDHSRMKKFNEHLLETSSIENELHFETHSIGSGIYHSAPVSPRNQNNNHLSVNAVSEPTSFCLADCLHSMTESHHSKLPSIERAVFTADIHISPPVQFESCTSQQENITPLVEQQATVTDSPQVEFHFSQYHPQPIQEVLLPPLPCPIQPDVVIIPFPETNPLSPIVSHSEKEQKHELDSTSPMLDMLSSYVDYDQSSDGLCVPKYFSNSDILCDICSAIVPNDTNMLYCDSCHLHLCGNCLLSSTYDHSINCPNVLRYMRPDEKHLQYVPKDSNDSSTVSDRSSISYDFNADAIVPKLSHFEQAKSDFTNWIGSLIAEKLRNNPSDLANTHDPGGS